METEKTMAVTSHNFSTIPGLFSEVVQKYGNQTAIRYKKFGLWHSVSWNEYFNRVRYCSMALISMDFKKGDKVAIIGDNAPEWITIDLGCLCAGGVSVGIYSTSSWQQCEHIVNHSESVFLFVENEEQFDKWLQFRERSPQLKKIVFWDDTGLRQFKDKMALRFEDFIEIGKKYSKDNPHLADEFSLATRPDDPAMLIYTSGTTGNPKGAVLTHSNITWMAEAISNVNPLYQTDDVVSFLPLCHIFERLFSVISHVKYGYTVNLIENLDTVTDNIIEISPTVGYGVPRIWEKYYSLIMIKVDDATWLKRNLFKVVLEIGKNFVRYKEKYGQAPLILKFGFQVAQFVVFRKLRERIGLDRIRIAYSGAAPISRDILIFFRSIGVNLQEGYGQTEGVGVASVCEADNWKTDTVGKPLPGSEVKIADDGEILVKSPAVFNGYYKDSLNTQATVKNGWLYSGDIGKLDENGYLNITGRKKDIIITAGGKNIAPQYIENQLKFSAYIYDAVVFGDSRKYLTAVIMIDEDNVVKYAQDNKIQFSTYSSLAKTTEILRLIQDEVNKVNEMVSTVEQIRKFALFPKKLYEEDGEVTPTMKIKRKNIEEKYKDLIENMYL